MTKRPAAFLDRDGTIMRDASYVRDPLDVELLPGTAEALAKLNARDIPVIVVTNQSGIARGWLTDEDYARVRSQLDALLAAKGAQIDATYMCPHHPDFTGPCDCRKPGTALYQQAIDKYNLDPMRSLFSGDRWRDVAPSKALGGLGILLDVESTPADDRVRAIREGFPLERSLGAAVDRFLATLPR
jgi:D-glycero-D-manno-heptose 1,7-bisphosphate phosphatase